jgi:hypothetical protein
LATIRANGSVKKQPRDKISARIDPDVLEAVERVGEVERRPISSVVRNVFSDSVCPQPMQIDSRLARKTLPRRKRRRTCCMSVPCAKESTRIANGCYI